MRTLTRRHALALLATPASGACGLLRRVNEVVFGEVAARAGERGVWGEDLHRGFELAIAQVNHRGGLNGRPVRLVTSDTGSHDDRAGSLATRLIDRESAMVVFGEVSSAANEKAALVAQRKGVVFIAAGSTARDLTRVGDFVFRTALTDAEQAAALARFSRQTLQRRRVAVLYRRAAFLGLSLADEFIRGFRANGGEVVLRESFEEDADLVRLVGRIRASGADTVYAPGDAADAARMALALRQGRVAAQVLGSDGWSSGEVRRAAREACVGAVFPDAFSYAAVRPEVETFVTAFRERYRAQPGTFAALGYDAARWVMLSATRVRQLEARTLRDALLGSRLDDGVAGGFSVDARRALLRPITLLRYTNDGVEIAGTMTP